MDALRRKASARRLAVVLAALGGLVLAAIVVPNATATSATAPGVTPPCQVTDQVSQWAGGFTSTITVTNNGPAIASWTVTWTFGGNQHVTSAWSAQVAQTGSAVPGLIEDGVPTPNIDDQWLGHSWRPKLTDLKLGWESYGGGGPDGLWFDDVALGASRIGCG